MFLVHARYIFAVKRNDSLLPIRSFHRPESQNRANILDIKHNRLNNIAHLQVTSIRGKPNNHGTTDILRQLRCNCKGCCVCAGFVLGLCWVSAGVWVSGGAFCFGVAGLGGRPAGRAGLGYAGLAWSGLVWGGWPADRPSNRK